MTNILEDRKKCTGCAACAQICTQDAIRMKADEEGFLHPEINPGQCTDCGLCVKTCPVNTALNREAQGESCEKPTKAKAYACFSKDENIRSSSSSGGVFSLLAESVLKEGGVVFGAEFDENFRVRHGSVDKVDELDKLRRSKYVQSDVGDTYKKAKAYLRDGKKVLYCGTPCQIAGLKSFLNREYGNLLTCDLACHGVPSPKVWNMYLQYLKEKFQSPIVAISFRDKSTGWKNSSMRIAFSNGRQYRDRVKKETFFIGFGKSIFNRNSCFDCKFRIQNTAADLTLADFWGIDQYGGEELSDNRGVSLVIPHTKAGEEALSLIKDRVKLSEQSIDRAITDNPRLVSSVREPALRKTFFSDLTSGFTFDQLRRKYMDNFSVKYRIKCFVKFVLRWNR